MDPQYVVDIAVPEVTQSVVDNGAVMVYTPNQFGEWVALPNTFPQSGGYSSVYHFSHWLGYVSLYKTDTDYTTPALPADMQVKIVTIGEKTMLNNPAVNWNKYSEVSDYFDLK